MPKTNSDVSLVDALIPVSFLVLALFASVSLFGEDSSYGPNQIALMLAGCLALLIGVWRGSSWAELEHQIFQGMIIVFLPSFILLAVGIMIATWIAGGVVPSMIYYGLKLINPSIFYATSCLVCAVVSLSIGSSWTTAASIGVALIGIALGTGLSPEITAGAVISGAYFGDKMSPLSDTTNLAPAVAGVDLFTHIRHMAWTGVPALAFALFMFLIMGFFVSPPENTAEAGQTLALLQSNFHVAWYMLLPLFFLLFLAVRKMPALPAILLAAAVGAVFSVVFQSESLLGSEAQGPVALFKAIWALSVNGYTSDTGDSILDDLLSGGGAANMLNTIWLILSAVFFGSAMEKTGLLQCMVEKVLKNAHGTAGTITATVLTGIGANIITGDQYIAIVLPGRMYKIAFQQRGLAPVNLSRAIEDSSTVTSPLVPWNTCGAFMAASLGVATIAYLPFCFFNLAMPVISVFYAVINFRILPLEPEAALL